MDCALPDTRQTVMLTFALGTATGDLTGFCFDIGSVDSALLFDAAILVLCVLHRFAWLNAIAAPLAAAVCATRVGYLGWSDPRADPCTPALGTAGLR